MVARSTPRVDDTVLVGVAGAASSIAVDSPAWYAWLEDATSFAFRSAEGGFTARKERRGRTGSYWKAYRKHNGTLHRAYLGKSADLTYDRLHAIASELAGRATGSPPRASPTIVSSARNAADGEPALQSASATAQLLMAKLSAPLARSKLVPRPHLTERLQAGLAGKLTLIAAPAGFGKTTLVSAWRATASSALPLAWVALDEDDNDPIRFWNYVIAALNILHPDVGAAALVLLHSPQPPPIEAILTTLLNTLNTWTADVALMLDDYHLIDSPPIHQALAFLLDYLPPRLHLVIATRVDPPLPLARLRGRGQLCEVRASDLRFGAAEASTFLRTVMGLDLAPTAIAAIHDRTEGWVTGLQLAALALRGSQNVSAFLTAFTGSHRFVLDYLSEEVLAQQSATVQTFLFYTAILERLSGSLCDVMTEQTGSQAMLEALEQANLFVVALDAEQRWYRYHPLFAEVLRSRLQKIDPGLVPVLHQRASTWYEQQGLVIEAVQHALAAADFERMAEMIERVGLSIAYQGQVHMVLGWLNALPDVVVAMRPILCILHADLLMYTYQTPAAEARLQLAERAVLAELPLEQQEIIQGLVAVIRAQIARYAGDLPACVTFARDALRLLPETRMWARAAAVLNVAHDYLISGAVPPATEQLIVAVLEMARSAGDLVLQLRSITLLARFQVLQGRLRQAATTYGEALRIIATPDMLGFLPGGSAYCFGLGEILREWNDLDGAENQLKQGVETLGGTLLAATEDITLGYLALARVQHARGNDDGARASLAAFADVAAQRHFPPYLQARGVAVQVQFELAHGNLTPARRWLASSGLSADDGVSFAHEQEYLVLARVLLALAGADPVSPLLQDALRLLDRLLADAEAKTRVRSALEILVVQALAFAVQADWVAALASLKQALVRAEPEGYVRLFLDEGTAMVALLRDAHAQGVTPAYVTTLLAACGEHIGAVPAPRPGGLLEPLTVRESDVLRLLVAGLSNAAIARELVVTIGTVKSHVNHIYGKLGVTSRTQAIARTHALHIA